MSINILIANLIIIFFFFYQKLIFYIIIFNTLRWQKEVTY